MKKILVIPSWYPTEKDKVNGSFFQEQARILSDNYDIKVLYIQFINRPKIELTPGSIIRLGSHMLKFFLLRHKKVLLPDEEIFLLPPLLYHVFLTFTLTKKSFYKIVSRIYLKKIKQLIDDGWSPDLIHAHSVHFAGIIGLQAKLKLNIPYVLTEHMPFNILSYPKCIQKNIKESFLKSDCVLSVSYDKVRQLGMNGIDIEPNIVYNFIDENMFDAMVIPYQHGSPLKIISIGAASYLKDHLTLLKALNIIKSKGISFTLTMIGLRTWGENETYDSIIRFIETNGLKRNIQVIDSVPRREIIKYLLLNNIFLITSIAEGLPVSVLEAMATGLTVIATKHGGTEDILTQETGILVNIKDFQDIADKLIDIYSGTRQFEPKIIRDHVVSICGRKVFRERLSNYYDQIISKNNADKNEK